MVEDGIFEVMLPLAGGNERFENFVAEVEPQRLGDKSRGSD
jgi:hypothetical protein